MSACPTNGAAGDTAWPPIEEFEPLRKRNAPGGGAALVVSVARAKSQGLMATVSLSAEMAEHLNWSVGTALGLAVAQNDDALFLQLSAAADGDRRVSQSPGKRAAGTRARLLVRLGGLGSLPLAEGKVYDPSFSNAASGCLVIRLAKGAPASASEPPPAPAGPRSPDVVQTAPRRPSAGDLPGDTVAIKIARRMAGERKADSVILRALEEDQNIRRDQAWLDQALERAE